MSGVVFAEKYTLYKFSYKAQMNFNIPIKNPVLLFKLVNKKLEYFNYWIIRVRGSLRKEKSLKTGYNRYIKRCWFFQVIRLRDIDSVFFTKFEDRMGSGGRTPPEKDYFEPGVPDDLVRPSHTDQDSGTV